MPHSGHSNSPTCSTFPDLPRFSESVSTAPLLRISLSKLLNRDPEEEERCWNACCDLGFFYLDLRTLDQTASKDVDGTALLRDAAKLFEVMKGFFELPIEEKAKYDFADQGSYFGYKGYGAGIVDRKGTRDRNEFYNISKDDMLGLGEQLPSPSVLNPYRALYISYIHSSHAICMLVASLLSSRLPLKPAINESGGLPALHKLNAVSGDQIRFVKAPPQEQPTEGVALGEHTDFGSVTVLFNRLGGLQVKLPEYIEALPPGSSAPCSPVERELCEDGWTYVRPLPGHCIVNLGDALVKFSAGKLRSNIHRVVAPPGEQGGVTRYSLVYFCRPGDDVLLRSLVEGGTDGEEEEVSAKEWILRRALGRRKMGGWEGSGGTERVSMRGGTY
ncbi:Clavaminate synthase-like protein [Lentithecium fluviatile CBS 122367]|uniref:Clavaminate synthase-like protein n=1 Tax=Lentithecium fluviatile CBS 122367 TaxID=1168545 RepID=A0A6G1J118_9PLEO|nr:Clavaminate synthase-like protein [Lentithecium fluviatile CBS 122367]